ncbi:phosphatase PAP2 family protein [Alteromonas pelagimontana]|uniref:Phosphatase PAP2 family protein n=1 Tax=Alteromonas pelagimontana TaxID=1858656 RepID=A0A6M4MDI9_9ALTE|nr:phosphatase PAP2 family protein [Alteromonas pelagimontana]QJR80700.1 phosphatase PAP2 family protein [Alteromonas pelagimontana]
MYSFTSRSVCAFLLLFFCKLANAATHEDGGDIGRILLPATAYALTFVEDDKTGRYEFYRSFASNVVATQLLKMTVHKDRPDLSGDDAFPSGHASMAFQAATFLQLRYGKKYGVPAFAVASYVAWTRVDADKHDWADVGAGAAIGALSSYFFTHSIEGVQITPVASVDYSGIFVSGTF